MEKNMRLMTLKIFMLLLLVIWVSSSYAQEPEPIGIVTAVKGDVVVVSGGKSEVVEKGTNVFLGDRFETKDASGVKIVFNDDTLISLGENTNFDITEFVYTPKERKSYYNIFKGKLKGIVQKVEGKDSNVEFATPNAVAGIKGTTGYIDADAGEIGVEGSEFGLFVRRKDRIWEIMLKNDQYINTFDRTPMPKPFYPGFKEKFENLIEEAPSDEEYKKEFPEEELPSEKTDLTPFGAPGVPPILQDPTQVIGGRVPVDVVVPPPPIQQSR
jgi:hypothetical protein